MKDILIIGAGPAGSTAAFFLAKKDFRVSIIERNALLASPKSPILKVGESLPPAAKTLLQQLEVWEEFEQAGHLKCYGNKSYWGSETPGYSDFINQVPAYGWHIDRTAFEQMLLRKAQSYGVKILAQTTLKKAQRQNHRWEVQWSNVDGKMETQYFDFIVDASGRSSWLARRQGIERRYENHQLALVTFLQSTQAQKDASSLIETSAQGWCHSANIPNGKIATAFLCKPSKVQRDLWLKPAGWWALLQQAPHSFERIKANGGAWYQAPKFVAADSGILKSTYGPGWLAVGDAAMTYDPIASHGIMMALVSARDAAKAIAAHAQGFGDAFEQYDHMLGNAYYHYVKQRNKFYQAEKRFAEDTYWALN